jgi:thermitase
MALMAGAFAQGTAPDQLIVKFKPGSQAVETQVHAAAGVQVLRKLPSINWTLVKIPANKTKSQVASIYRSYPNYVTDVTENPIVEFLDTTPNDADYSKQWGPAKVQAPKMWDRNTGGTSTIVAIVDSGADMDHPDLAANLLPGFDVGDNDPNPEDVVGHGTHCCGIAGAVGNNSIGVAGMGWKHKIMPIRIESSTTGAFNAAAGIVYAADHGASVVSMSFRVGASPAMNDAIDYAWGKNILLVAAAGNDGTQEMNFPASHSKVMAVASSAQDDSRSVFSNYGDWVDVAAPGEAIWSTVMGGGYDFKAGTSMACPLVAGLAGVLFAEGGVTMKNQQVWDILCASSDKVNYVKFGRVNAGKAINMIEIYKTVAKNPTLVTKYVGTTMLGTASQLFAKDGQVVLVSSALQTTTGSTAGVIIDYTLAEPISSFVDPSIHLAVKTDVSATQMVYFYNNTKNTWDFNRSTGTNSTFSNLSVSLPEAMGSYITAQGKIRILVRTHVPVTRTGATSFRMQLDLAVFEGKVRIN